MLNQNMVYNKIVEATGASTATISRVKRSLDYENAGGYGLVFERLKKEKMKAKLIMQVHDELIVEAPENEAEKARKILVEEMENAFEMKVKLVSEAGIGKTWYLAKD